jgi:hypothetical protein
MLACEKDQAYVIVGPHRIKFETCKLRSDDGHDVRSRERDVELTRVS